MISHHVWANQHEPISQKYYYKKTQGLSGNKLKNALQKIIKNDHKRLSYRQVWKALQYTDEDMKNTDNVILVYSGRSHSKQDRDGQPGSNNNSWNREHIWAKSLGFPKKSQLGYTDLHHLKPADKSINSSRGPRDFDDGGRKQKEAADTFRDKDSWEPRDEVKGDIARMLFYMDTRYDGRDKNMPDLRIVNHTRTNTGTPEIGVLCTLLQWHQEDPVDKFESRRNQRIFELQKNRNPFIDNPQWVTSIWGRQCK